MATRAPIDLDIPRTQRSPRFQATMKRVNVIVGPNGSGKSSLLYMIRDHISSLYQEAQILHISDKRSIALSDRGKPVQPLTQQNPNRRQHEQRPTREKQRAAEIRNLLVWLSEETSAEHFSATALQVFIDDEASAYTEHEKRHQKWKEDAIPGQDAPSVRETKFDIFKRRLAGVLPNLKIRLLNRERFEAASGASPQLFSSGERQIFALLLVLETVPAIDYFVVDEPELNLHPGLAAKLWSEIEVAYPDSTFIYATHSYDFAARPSTELITVLRGQNAVNLVADDFEAIASETRSLLLTSVSTASISSTLLFCEGTTNSLDAQLLECLCAAEPQVKVSPAGSSPEVLNAAIPGRSWQNALPDIRVSGIVDRDYRPQSEISRIEDSGVLVHAYHEIESYFAHPEVVTFYLRAFGKTVISLGELLELYRQPFQAQDAKVREAMRRWTAAHDFTFKLSVPSRVSLRTLDEAISAVKGQIQEFNRKTGENSLTDSVAEAFNSVEKDLESTDAELLLRAFPGKPILTSVARLWAGRGHEAFSPLLAILRATPLSKHPTPFRLLRERIVAAALGNAPRSGA